MHQDGFEKRLTQLEKEIAAFGQQWKLLTSAPDTGELGKREKYLGILYTFFSDDELDELCLLVGVNYDALPASGSYGKSIELIKYLERHGRLEKLYQLVRQKRAFLFFEENGDGEQL